jgi:hypothetical protein
MSLFNSAIFLDHGIRSALVLVTSYRNGSSWSVLVQDTHLTCTTTFGTPDPIPNVFHIHITIAINRFHNVYELGLARNLLVSKNLNTNHCFIRKSVEALITNEQYCLRASNNELKLGTNILHCIDYQTHAQTFLSSH